MRKNIGISIRLDFDVRSFISSVSCRAQGSHWGLELTYIDKTVCLWHGYMHMWCILHTVVQYIVRCRLGSCRKSRRQQYFFCADLRCLNSHLSSRHEITPPLKTVISSQSKSTAATNLLPCRSTHPWRRREGGRSKLGTWQVEPEAPPETSLLLPSLWSRFTTTDTM